MEETPETSAGCSQKQENYVSIENVQTTTRSRPKLPSFSLERKDLRPVESQKELRRFVSDIASQRRLNYVKSYTTARALTPCRLRSMGLMTFSPPICSSTEQNTSHTEKQSEKKLKRSLSLKLLTHKLKRSPCPSLSVDIPYSQSNLSTLISSDFYSKTSTSFTTDKPIYLPESINFNSKTSNFEAREYFQQSRIVKSCDCLSSTYSVQSSCSSDSTHDVMMSSDPGVIEKFHPVENYHNEPRLISDRNNVISDSESSNVKKQSDRFVSSLVVTGLSVTKHESADQKETQMNMPATVPVDPSMEDEGLCLDEGPNLSDFNRESTSFTIRPPRSMSIISSGKTQRVIAVGPENRKESENLSTEEVMVRRQPRFVTHPPHRKTALKEMGLIDSNGLGSLQPIHKEIDDQKSVSTPCDSAACLTDSHISFGDSDVEYIYEHSTLSDPEEISQKEFSDSYSALPHPDAESPPSIASSLCESMPLLIREEDLTIIESDLPTPEPLNKCSSSSNIFMQQSSLSTSSDELKIPRETAVPNKAEEHTAEKPVLKKKYNDMPFARHLSPRLERDRMRGGRFSTTVPPLMSKSLTSDKTTSADRNSSRPYTLLLSVPPPKKPVFRSVSSASALNKERRTQSTSVTLEKSSDPNKFNESSPFTSDQKHTGSDFLEPFCDMKMSIASSMPDVLWESHLKNEQSMLESPDNDNRIERPDIKDKRYLIVEELHNNEQEYVDALQTLKDKYMKPLKNQSILDENVVDDIFYMIPEILTHHLIYHSFLDRVWKNWDSKRSTVGDIIISIFSKQTVLNSYLSFVENYKTSGKVIEHAIQTKSSVMKFVNKCQNESGSKLSLKDLIVRPIQRIPRYELLIQRLNQHTPNDHPDKPLLAQAEKAMHDLAVKIGSANDGPTALDTQETLKKLESLLLTELAVPERVYLKHDLTEISNKKDICYLWLFSDVLIFSIAKRKTGAVIRKASVILKTPSGQDFVENVKHKVWLQVGLDDVEILKGPVLTNQDNIDPEQSEDDLTVVAQIEELSQKLLCEHQSLTDVLSDLNISLQKQASNRSSQTAAVDPNKMELLVTTQEGVLNLIVTFPTAEKRMLWEIFHSEAKQKLSQLSDKRAPEFLQPLPITKTRAGMQFSCAAGIDGLSRKGHRDVWVCNSDGYVGHVCLLSLQPEPIVTLNTPIPGCHSRILCIAAVPSFNGPLKRKSSIHTVREFREAAKNKTDDEEESETGGGIDDEDGYQSDSETSEDEPLSFRAPQIYLRDADDRCDASSLPTSPSYLNSSQITTSGVWFQEPTKSTMWLGTEDGSVHIFQCTDNLKTTKNKLRLQHSAPVHSLVYLDNKVFVALGNGDLVVYKRDLDGIWNCDQPVVKTLGNTASPINKMIVVAGRLWCGIKDSVSIINSNNLHIEKTFVVMPETKRAVQCLVSSAHTVWVACMQSSSIFLYHATSYDFLLHINVANIVSQKLQSTDDIIRQHKTACLRITALLVCKDLLWVGTSAGVILNIPVPKVTSTTKRGLLPTPSVTGLLYGHTGHVRFLTSVELPPQLSANETSDDSAFKSTTPVIQRRMSLNVSSSLMATRMLVISGGDGYEDFRPNVPVESAGQDDSTNHLLLWHM